MDFTRRFRVGAVLTLPLLVITMGPFLGFGGMREAFGERGALWIEVMSGHTRRAVVRLAVPRARLGRRSTR